MSWALRTDKPFLVVGKKNPEPKRSLGADVQSQFAAIMPVW